MKLAPKKFGFATRDGYKEFFINVKVSTDYRFYYVTDEIPKELMELEIAPHGKRVYADSAYELFETVEKLVTEFELSLVEETKSKVILYSIEYKDNFGERGIDFRWIVVQKVEMKSGKRTDFRYFKERKSSSDYHQVQALDQYNTYSNFEDKFLEMVWTVEREHWFEEMERAIDALAKRLKQGFGKRAELLAMKIDQNGKFLLTGNSEDNKNEQDK